MATHSPTCLGHQRGTLYKGTADCDTYDHNQVPQTRALDTLPDSLNVRCALGGGEGTTRQIVVGAPPLPPPRTLSGGTQVVAQLILRGGKKYRSTGCVSGASPPLRIGTKVQSGTITKGTVRQVVQAPKTLPLVLNLCCAWGMGQAALGRLFLRHQPTGHPGGLTARRRGWVPGVRNNQRP